MTVPAVKAARAATSAAGRRHTRRRQPATDPRVSAPGSKAAQQRQAIEDVKARRAPDPAPVAPPAPESPSPASPGGGFSVPAIPAAVSTGSGFLLGVGAWAIGLAYLRGGAPEVRRFLAAKFFNKVGG
jgi:hypothetical protein